jgi:DNA-binding response OmpR family regulator
MPNTAKKILIVEDEEALLNALPDKLTSEGFSVDKAENGEQGLNQIQKEKPDLILLDIIMPKMDGMQMLGMMKQNPETKDVPVLILSNLDDNEKMEQAKSKGIIDYFIIESFQFRIFLLLNYFLLL